MVQEEFLLLRDNGYLFEETSEAPGEVTVVVPVHNYASYLLQALDSVASQTLAAIDLVIVDDASTDDSLHLATSWARGHASRAITAARATPTPAPIQGRRGAPIRLSA